MVEVGTLAGYSGIQIARALGPDGYLHTIEVNPEFAEVARESFKKAGVADNVTVRTHLLTSSGENVFVRGEN